MQNQEWEKRFDRLNEDGAFPTENEVKFFIQELLTSSRTSLLSQIEGKRGEIEKLLWKHYEPDMAPNMEELAGEIVALLSDMKK